MSEVQSGISLCATTTLPDVLPGVLSVVMIVHAKVYCVGCQYTVGLGH